MAHSLVLIKKQVAELQTANEAATRRRSHKRKRIQKEGTLTVGDGAHLALLKEFGVRSNGERVKKRRGGNRGEPSQRRCKTCGEAGHNSRTCK